MDYTEIRSAIEQRKQRIQERTEEEYQRRVRLVLSLRQTEQLSVSEIRTLTDFRVDRRGLDLPIVIRGDDPQLITILD